MTGLTKGKWGLAINASLTDWVILGHAMLAICRETHTEQQIQVLDNEICQTELSS